MIDTNAFIEYTRIRMESCDKPVKLKKLYEEFKNNMCAKPDENIKIDTSRLKPQLTK
jgi:hypothetical protein